MTDLLDDYRWLISADAAVWLARLAHQSAVTVAEVRRVRRALTASRTHLVMEQCELRRRAAAKFDAADQLFFTRRALEQATDQWIARLKASRFPPGEAVADLCCGIGGDLFPLAARTRVTGVDRDPIHTLLAAANGSALGLSDCDVQVADASTWPVDQYSAWHIDPDRRPHGRRTSHIAWSEPPLEAVRRLLALQPQGTIKLAPAAELPDDWTAVCERQWIGSGRECRQQVAWFGTLAQCPGSRAAVIVDRRGQVSPPLFGQGDETCAVASVVGRFVYEPHACVLAARLTGALARELAFGAVSPGVSYLTSDKAIHDPRLDAFEVVDVLPMDRRRVREWLRARQIGHLEVKKRGLDIDPQQLRRELEGRGEEQATLLVTPHAGSVRAIVARRTENGGLPY